jgi:carboxymethylenebutenolidase
MSSESSTERKDVTAGLVRYPARGVGGLTELDGFLARPDDGKPHPGVIVIQEWWGLEPHIKSIAERLAAAGYVALAPDLYHGKVATEPDEASKQMMALNLDLAVDEIQQAIDYLQSRDDVQPKKVGVVGFCMGGRLTWRVAERENGELAAIAPFYAGYYQPTPSDIQKVTAPALVVWGTRDQSIPASQRDHIEKLLRDEGKTYRALLYDAGHAFMNDTHPTYHASAASQAWSELLGWLKRYLG